MNTSNGSDKRRANRKRKVKNPRSKTSRESSIVFFTSSSDESEQDDKFKKKNKLYTTSHNLSNKPLSDHTKSYNNTLVKEVSHGDKSPAIIAKENLGFNSVDFNNSNNPNMDCSTECQKMYSSTDSVRTVMPDNLNSDSNSSSALTESLESHKPKLPTAPKVIKNLIYGLSKKIL